MEDLVEKARAGDTAAESRLFAELSERFRTIAKLRIGEAHSEDLAQEACATVFEKYKTESFTIGFLPWAHGVLKMKIGNYLQKRNRWSERVQGIGDEVDVGVSTDVDPDLKRFLMDCLKEITGAGGNYARILNLSYQGFATGDICERLRISANNFYVALSRGRSILRRCLEAKGVTA
jgi:RNA polymerase sigma factor (sigma-70 family)